MAHEGGWQLAPLLLRAQHKRRRSSDQDYSQVAPRDIASEAKDYVPRRTDGENMDLDIEPGLGGVGRLSEVQQVMFQRQHQQKPVSFLSLGPEENEKFLDDVYRIPGFYNQESQFWKPYVNCLRVYNYNEGIFRLDRGSAEDS